MHSSSFFVFFCWLFVFFFFKDTATTEIYTLSLHDALPISQPPGRRVIVFLDNLQRGDVRMTRSEEHTSELQSRVDLVCRLLLEKKNHHQLGHETKYVTFQVVLCLEKIQMLQKKS